jgi:hypothetical protein
MISLCKDILIGQFYMGKEAAQKGFKQQLPLQEVTVHTQDTW